MLLSSEVLLLIKHSGLLQKVALKSVPPELLKANFLGPHPGAGVVEPGLENGRRPGRSVPSPGSWVSALRLNLE